MITGDFVRIVEVGPRDGLQNEAITVPTAAKIAFIDALSHANLPVIEVGSFVSPQWVPQMADSAAVFAGIEHRPSISYPMLVPNLKGLEAAQKSKVKEIAVFASASESFSEKNINCTIHGSLERYKEVIQGALDAGMTVRGYVSCVLGCPYEGEVMITDVVRVAEALAEMGCYEVSLGDTIGVGTATHAREVIKSVAGAIGMKRVAIHFHDTWGQALANILACVEIGVRTVDASAGGLGGCPYAKGATGNVATEDVLYLLDGLAMPTGVDLDHLCRATEAIFKVLGRTPNSRVAQAIAARRP